MSAGVIAVVVGVIVGFDTAGGATHEMARVPVGTNHAATVVVTASRAPRDVQSEPGAVYALDALDATRSEGVRTTPDAVRGVPSTMVQKTGYGQGSPYLRGFTGFRTLCAVDGIRLNNSVFRDGPNQYWNTVDPLGLSDYELVMGPGSVLYGSDAVGGMLNALSLAPPDYNGAPVWAPALFYRGASADDSTVGRAQLGARLSERAGFTGGVSLKEFGDLSGGRRVGRQPHTGYDEWAIDGRLDYYLNDHSRVTLGHQTVDQDDAWRTHRTIYGIDWEGLAKGDDKVHSYDQRRDLTYLRYSADELGGAVDAVEATVSRQAQTEDLYRLRKDDKSDRQGFDVETWGTVMQLRSGSPVGDWVYGAEYYRDDVASYSRKYKADGSLDKVEIQGPVADDATYDSVGVFVQDTIGLGDGRLDLVPGVRYTYAHADARRVKDPVTGGVTSLDEDWDTVVGSLRALVPLTADRRHVVYASAAQGFRAPNLSDLTRLDIARSGELETAAPGLDPERYVACEIGAKSRTARLVSQLSLYHTTIDNMIVRAPTGQTIDGNMEVTKKNSGDGYVQGVEWSERFLFSHSWSTWLACSWMNGKVDAYPNSTAERERDYVSRLMPPTGQVGVRWQTADAKYWTELIGDMADKADHLSADDERDAQRIPPGGTPGYIVGTVRAGARLWAGFECAVAVENVTDEDYRIHGSGVNEPGRNLVLTASCMF